MKNLLYEMFKPELQKLNILQHFNNKIENNLQIFVISFKFELLKLIKKIVPNAYVFLNC